MALSWTPEGPSDLCFTMVFEHFMFRIVIVLRSLISPHGAQHRPNMGPKRAPKTAQIGVSLWPGHSLFRLRCWKALEDRFGSDWGPSWGPSWAPLGPTWAPPGPSWAPLGPTWGHLGHMWGSLGPSWVHLGGQLGSFGALVDPLEAIVDHFWNILR